MLDHLRQHDVAPRQRPLRIEHRIVITGTFEHCDQRGAFKHVQFLRWFVEISPRSHFDTERVVQKRNGVEISFEYFVFGVGVFDFNRGDRFLDLARYGSLASDLGIEVACQLLGERRSILRALKAGRRQGVLP